MTQTNEESTRTKEKKTATVKKTSEKKASTPSKKKTISKDSTKSSPSKNNTEEITTIQEGSPVDEEAKKQSSTTKKASATQTKKKVAVPTTSSNTNGKTSYIDISSGIKDKEGDSFKLTKRGLEILKSELKELKTVKRAEISERIRQARALGDLSENSEYEDAKREQAVVEIRVSELENMLRKSIIVDEDLSDDNTETVRMGHSVVIESIEFKERKTFKIVSVLEADPFTNAISNVSPLGSALIGHQVGNVIRVVLPTGAVRYRLVEICKKES
ncbi:MAG: transcription elongation factor GreA [Caldisericia bacterium]|nr:transcription elongation factor GreA [Caldisericia bacterium]MDD4614738.1 transcription elongation factor GreA [Caldisericia bacterium]